MAQRQALTDLQQRLAQRLAQARQRRTEPGWLAVLVDGRGVLLALDQIGEIFQHQQVLPVPYTREWMLGVVNLRGSVCTAIDLGALLRSAGLDWPALDAVPSQALQLVTVNPCLQVNAAFRIDALAGLRHADDFATQQPASAGAPAYWGPCWQDAQAQRWQVLDLQPLVHSPEFLGVAV
ncbi:MAG: hypothetical protein OHK0048_02240 [Rhodoferax sp.]